MRWHEIESGLRLPVSSEEQDLLSRAKSASINHADLDERDQELARLMVSRGLLHRRKNAEGITSYRTSSTRDLWRF